MSHPPPDATAPFPDPTPPPQPPPSAAPPSTRRLHRPSSRSSSSSTSSASPGPRRVDRTAMDPLDDAELGGGAAPPHKLRSAGAVSRETAVQCFGCMGRLTRDFRDFALFGSFMELAVAFVMGAAFHDLVGAFTSAFITPLVGMIGRDSYRNLKFTINGSDFVYGLFIDSVITFLITTATIFFFVVEPTRALIRRIAPSELKRSCPYCLSVISARASRCMYCTQEVPPVSKEDLVTGEDFSRGVAMQLE